MTQDTRTMQETWAAVDAYIDSQLVPSDPALDAALAACVAERLPAISVTPSQGKLLQLLARLQGAKNILEIGTLGGYSTIWLARALPAGGRGFGPQGCVSAAAGMSRSVRKTQG